MIEKTDTRSRRVFKAKEFGDMLAPIYYRHEFARRNAAVVQASNVVLAAFPMTAALAQTGAGYLRREDGEIRTLVDDLTVEFLGAHGGTKERMREALGRYAQKHGLLPVVPPPLLFFPSSMAPQERLVRKVAGGARKAKSPKATDATELAAIWCSLVRYEQLLLGEGMVDRPCFMPVVPLPRGCRNTGSPIGTSLPQRDEAISQFRFVAFDASEKRSVLDGHFQTMVDYWDVLKDVRRDGGGHRRASTTHWRTHELCLRAFDHEQTCRDETEQRAIRFHNDVIGGRPLVAGQKSRRIDDAFEKYRECLRAADSFIAHYDIIGKPSAF